MRIFSVVGLALLGTSAAAEPEGAVAGRLVFVDGSRQLTFREAEREIDQRITVELRRGASVVEAEVDSDGYFVASGPAGQYRLEYLSIAERAEFIPPQELQIEAGVVTCAGTVAVRTSHIENLGANQDNQVTVTDDCARMWPRLYKVANRGGGERVALARTGPLIENPERKDLVDYGGEVAFELGAGSSAAFFRTTFVHPFGSGHVNPSVYAGAGLLWSEGTSLFRGPASGFDLTLGAGVQVFYLDALLFAGLRPAWGVGAPSGPVLGLYGRFPFGPFGIGARYELLPTSGWSVFLDVRPVALFGILL